MDDPDLLQLHRIDPNVPLEDQIGVLSELQREGKIRHIGLSKATVQQIEAARQVAPISTVQNLFNLIDRGSEDVLKYSEQNNITFIPWYPLATGKLASDGGPLDELARRYGCSSSQLALAWLLHRSPIVLPIPGTRSTEHLEQNIAAASVVLDADAYAALYSLSRSGTTNIAD